MNEQTTVLFRPVGPRELALIRQSNYAAFPPRLDWQPIFYPVVNEVYANQIAHDWNVRDSGSGYVTRFAVATEFLQRYDVHQVGASHCLEYWIPAEDLTEFNTHIVGQIEIIREFHVIEEDS